MFPDYPKQKRKLHLAYLEYLKLTRDREAGVAGQLGIIRYFEGDKYRCVREDGSSDEDSFQLMSSKVELTAASLEVNSVDTIQKAMEATAKDLGGQQARMFFDALDKATEEIGNAIDGSEYSNPSETIIAMYEKLELDFDDDGQVKGLCMVIHPSQTETMQKAWLEIQNNPTLKNKFDSIIEAKREAWRVRESNRELVG